MPQDLLDFLRVLLPAFVGGAACYAAIRAELAATREKAKNAAESAANAHLRIDALYTARRD